MAKIHTIHDTAAALFLRQGYKNTQISHIASTARIGVGTIYTYFKSKEEIRDFILKCTITPGFIDQEFALPISGDLFEHLEREIMDTFQRTADQFARKLGAADYSFPELISDAFDLLAQYAVGCLYIEKNFHDCGRLVDAYKNYRKQFFGSMTRYVQMFIDRGVLRPLEDVALSTNLIIEILTWWAMDMRYIAFESWDVPLEKAKAVCLDNILHAYIL